MRVLPICVASIVLELACTSAGPSASNSGRAKPLGLAHARVVVLPFAGVASPTHSAVARGLVVDLLAAQYRVSVVNPRSVDEYWKEHGIARGEYDRAVIQSFTEQFGAEVAIWGTVDRYTRRRPGSPGEVPLVSLTLYGLRVGEARAARVSGTEQGAFARQALSFEDDFDDFAATFEEVAEPLVRRLLAALP